jgi:hypothetical protein
MTAHHYLHTSQRTCHADDGRELVCEGSGEGARLSLEPRGRRHWISLRP